MNCQKCRTPLKLDSSLEDLNPAAYDLLVGTESVIVHYLYRLCGPAVHGYFVGLLHI